jgi:TolA-binding protein
MQEGNAALARRDYATAEAAAREVLGAGRASPRAGDANFLLAQALLGQRNYQGAAVAYDDAYNRARTGSRAPDALLGLANALSGLNEKPAACATLDKLRAEFPSVRADVREGAASIRARNGCR